MSLPTMHKTIHISMRLIASAAIFLYTAAPASAQLLKYNSQAEILGAAAVSPDSGRQVLKGLLSVCAQTGAQSRSTFENALAGWEKRHQLFLQENARIKQDFLRRADNPGTSEEERRAIKNMYEVLVPKTIEAQIASLATPINTIEDPKAKASLCNDYAQSVVEGQWDLQKNDPTLANFLADRIKKRGK